MYHYFFNDKSLKYEFIEIDMSNSEETDFEAAQIECLDNYINSKFPRELRNNYSESIGMIRAGFFIGIKFALQYYNIKRK